MQLRTYIEKFSQFDSNPSIDTQIEKGRTRLFDFDYPIFDKNYKKVFETHFITNFYTREIGFETEALFKFKLRNWLNINMPYFNKLFLSELIDFDPLVNTKQDVKKNKKNDKKQKQVTDSKGTSNASSKQDSSGSATEKDFSRDLESDNPDTRLTITTEDGSGIIEYATKIDEKTEDNTKTASNVANATSTDSSSVHSAGDSSINEIEDYIETIAGKSGNDSYSKMLNEYRSTFLRIENEIFNEINKELFMLIY